MSYVDAGAAVGGSWSEANVTVVVPAYTVLVE